LLRNTANAVNPNGFFVHGRREDFSLHFTESALANDEAGIGLIAPTPRTTIDRVNGVITHEVLLVFMKPDRPDTSEMEREAIIAAMDVLSNSYMQHLFANNDIDIRNETKTPDYRQFMGTLSGYSLTFKIIDKMNCNEI